MLTTDRRKQFAWGVIGVLASALAVLTLYAIFATQDLSQTVRSCVEPGGDCYRQARAQRMETVDLILRNTIATAVCARNPNVINLDRCVDRTLDNAAANPLGGRP